MTMARQSDLLAEPQPTAGVPVLLTRPEAEGRSFASSLIARFGNRVRPVVAPLLAPRYLMPAVPTRDYAAVVFTSAHGVEGARRLGVDLPRLAWCVGRQTAAAAAAAGFEPRSADGDADTLVSAICADPPKGRILYLRGVNTTGNVLEILTSSGFQIDEIVVYLQEAIHFGAEAMTLLYTGGDVIVPLFSTRTAALFRAELPPDARAALHFAVMSHAVAEPLAALPRMSLAIARHPEAKGMLNAVESLLAKIPVP
jgi:uroporphyrinogen-III synthase